MGVESQEVVAAPRRPVHSDVPFLAALAVLGGTYVVLIVAMLVADLAFTTPRHFLESLASPNIRYAIQLSLISCSITTILSLWVAVPLGYVLSRVHHAQSIRRDAAYAPDDDSGESSFSLRRVARITLDHLRRFVLTLLDALLDIPIVLPPLVIGLSLLILFQTPPGRALQRYIPITYAVPGVILAQFSVACAFAVRTMRVTFDQISPRTEQVALTLGCTRAQAFWLVVLPEARRGIITAGTLAWARSLGEFGPILVFGGATRMRTEVLSTTVFLELSIGNLEAAVAVSLLMVAAAVLVLVIVRVWGMDLGR